jgi:hypothetical protein
MFSVSLRATRPLDRENRPLYITSLVAYDGGPSPRRAELPLSINVVDKNDNSPVFEQQQYSQVEFESL